ncbi:sterol uptake control 2 [Fusarium heterosporum]|uniref:Sterol uptake control 2 n=1 Tax=Fusarium heterosporum TaxID=42747 RepID=A0A8H5TB24_FUSHE|nr:sterol uptake control 2 [Fusarium heterosporum]
MPPPSTIEAMTPTSGSGSGPGPGGKLRRAHRKSRNGCLECKRRHIKCDEHRPNCSNCVTSERTCSFPTPSKPAASDSSLHGPPKNKSQSRLQSPADSISSAGASQRPSPLPLSNNGPRFESDDRVSVTTLPSFTESFDFAESPLSSSTLPDAHPTPVYTIKHLILLHHFRKCTIFSTDNVDLITEVALEWSSQAPYALDQLLAIAADHFAMIHPESSASYRRIATELQTRAIAYFNRDPPEVAGHEARSLPRFLFSSLLSLHTLYDTFSQYRASFHVFIERFCDSVLLHTGVQSFTSPAYQSLLQSPLASFFHDVTRAAQQGEKGTECTSLIEFIQNSDLSPAAVETCTKAAHTLQWAFNVYRNLPPGSTAQAASAFPVVLKQDYIEILRKHRPEALLILAYYGVILHRCRHVWIFGDGGAFLIRLIAGHLGSYWQDAMRWPLEELEADQG